MTTTATTEHLPALPQWESKPEDIAGATREIKDALRARIAASGRTVQEVFDELEARIAEKVERIKADKAAGVDVWPVIDHADIAAGTVSPELIAKVKERGCAVIRGTFPHEQAVQWDQDIVDYVDRNGFFDKYTGPADDFFASVESVPEIYPIYWSAPQMEARQSPRMAAVQSFLNKQWTSDSEGVQWFDPDRDSLYPDRIRRRQPGTDSAGLGTHLDTGSIDLFMTEGYQQAFRHVFDGNVEAYDPWDAAHRTTAVNYPASTMCSAFRTFQGWTALSDMEHDQGVLHTVPIPEAMAYLLLRPLLDDVPDDEFCGVEWNRTFPIGWKWHGLLMEAVSGIPDVRAGDTVWWHCDLIHSVAPVADQKGWGNVMYIPAAPWCERNERYAASVREAFETGSSPSDFPEEHYERDWEGRFQPEQLNSIGRRGLGLEA